MQLLPDTAKGIAARTGGSQFEVDDLYDPEINVRYGSWYLRHLIDKYGTEERALAAYNGGRGTSTAGSCTPRRGTTSTACSSCAGSTARRIRQSSASSASRRSTRTVTPFSS
jgi:soluble lytic murein transglycosylase-like protein